MQVPSQLFIGGAWGDAEDGATFDVIDPATEEPVGRVPHATSADIDRALESSADGFQQWRRLDPWSRSGVLRKMGEWLRDNADQIAGVITEEQGKPAAQAAGEVGAAAEQFDWFADEARRAYGRVVEGQNTNHRILVRKEPIGPVAAFTPSNFPLLLPARKIAPALAAGCSIILKAAESTPRSANWLGVAAAEAGLPPGVLNLVSGDPAAISRLLVESPIIRKVALTGSINVGRLIAELAGRHLKPISLELGGHAPVLILDDVDPVEAAQVAATGKFRNSGQVCIAGSRFLVAEATETTFADAVVGHARSLRLGNGRTPGVDMGPLESARRVEATEALIEDAVSHGAKVAHGGRRSPEHDRGYFFEPTVLRDANTSMTLMRDEPFGPIAPIMSYASLDDAIAEANATTYGLAAFVFTHDLRRAFEVSEALEVGIVGVNNLTPATAEAPFGGVKDSGFGRESGIEGIEAYTTTKYVNMAL